MKLFSISLAIILGWLQYSFWFGKNNINDYWQIEATIAAQKRSNEQIKRRNEQQFAEISDLYDGKVSIEERARVELGLVKSNEQFYRIINEQQ